MCKLATVISLLVGIASAIPSVAQPVDRIAFQARWLDNESAPWDIHSIGIDGSDQTNLTNNASDDIDPAWSPNGEKIAFASNQSGSFQIYVMGIDGSNRIRLTLGPGDHLYPAWSPDGSQLAYSADELGVFDIYVMQADGSDPQNITESQGEDYAPSWSPDGLMLTFSSDRDRKHTADVGYVRYRAHQFLPNDIFVMNAFGGGVTNLTIGLEAEGFHEPSWSPQDGSIAFARFNSAPPWNDIGLLDASGGGVNWLGLVGMVFDLHTPAWSRDASTLAFANYIGVSGRTQGTGIYLMSASGGRFTQLTTIDWIALHPTWSPMSGPPPSTNVEQTPWGGLKLRFKKESRASQE